jgi:hypothetical protein
MATMTVKLHNRTDLLGAIKYILGYSEVFGAGGATPTWALSRSVPARHPRFPWLRATRITSIEGRGAAATKVSTNNLTWGEWKKIYLTIQFEQPTFPMLPDNSGIAEYGRWAVRVFKPNLETLARKGTAWTFTRVPNSVGVENDIQFVGDIYLRQPKGILEIKWFDVPEQWTHLGVGGIGGLIPTNISRAVGTLNSRFFPQTGVPVNQNNGTGTVRFAPGTLLMLEPDCKERTRLSPSMFTGLGIPADFFPRSYDWTFRWLYFDPQFDVTNSVIVTPQYDTTQVVIVRGHNLLPLVVPNAFSATQWYPATNNDNATLSGSGINGPGVAGAGGDIYLQYPYFNHELVFSYAQSLNATTGGLWPYP